MKTKSLFITAAWLKKRVACSDQVETFAKRWPRGCVVSLRTLKVAARLGLDLNWFASHVLTAPALKACEEATAPAWKAYEEATATAWKACEEATAPALWKALKNQEAR